MAYASLDDLLRRLSEGELIQLTDDGQTGEVDLALVSGAIQEADGIIDSFIKAQTAVPLSSPPALVSSLSADLALYRLMARRGLGVTSEVISLKEKAFSLLEKISKGEIRLFGDEAKSITGKSHLLSGDPEFSSKVLGIY